MGYAAASDRVVAPDRAALCAWGAGKTDAHACRYFGLFSFIFMFLSSFWCRRVGAVIAICFELVDVVVVETTPGGSGSAPVGRETPVVWMTTTVTTMPTTNE